MSGNHDRNDYREDQGWNGHVGRYVGNIAIVVYIGMLRFERVRVACLSRAHVVSLETKKC